MNAHASKVTAPAPESPATTAPAVARARICRARVSMLRVCVRGACVYVLCAVGSSQGLETLMPSPTHLPPLTPTRFEDATPI